MPEGHTIHRLALDQGADLAGRRLEASTAQDRFATGAARLDGQLMEATEAWGKHQFYEFESGEILHVHLGLIGKWFRRSGEVLPLMTGTTRLRLAASDPVDERLVGWDLIGPMTCRVVTPDDRDSVVATLGPDPLRPDADPEIMWERIHRSAKPVGLLLMEQDVVAGIGNVYRSELLNIVGVHPKRAGKRLKREDFDRLWAETVRQLRLGVKRNRIVTMRSDELPRPVGKLKPGEGRYAYKQEYCGRCHTRLQLFPLAGRTTWRCPTCQPR